jgi:cyclopropane fatty-acyl-phospholipid synthase-like methyltransferase
MHKPYSQACDNNKPFILDVLQRQFAACHRILEIGSGTGQHAVFFAARMPWLIWQTSDLKEHHEGIYRWLEDAPANALPPLHLDVSAAQWPAPGCFDGIFSANTLHIMGRDSVQDFFQGAGGCLSAGGVLCAYGPFNYGGRYTSDSNARFDQWLAQRDPRSGIRDFEAVCELATSAGFKLLEDAAMPANNRLLSWRRC